MKHNGIMLLSLLLAAGVGEAAAQTQADSTHVSTDSITWNKELEGVEIKAQRQLIKQEIDRIGRTDILIPVCRRMPKRYSSRCLPRW